MRLFLTCLAVEVRCASALNNWSSPDPQLASITISHGTAVDICFLPPTMNPASGHCGQEASSNPRTYIRPELRAKLDHLDLTGRASINSSSVVASGSFGDISKSQYTLGDGREATVTVKRLRFYLKEDINLVSFSFLLF